MDSEIVKIGTCTFQGINKYEKSRRLEFLKEIILQVGDKADALILPGGYFRCNGEDGEKYLQDIVDKIKDYLKSLPLTVCFGFDYDCKENIMKHQLAVAVDKTDIQGLAKKFYPTPQEDGLICLSTPDLGIDFNGTSYCRKIKIKNKKTAYLAICYDVFGISHKNIQKPSDVDYIFNFIHCFNRRGEPGSSDVYFAKNGLAGASKAWDVPVFAAAEFVNRDIAENWPTGVKWASGKISTKNWKYEYNDIGQFDEQYIDYQGAKACVRIFTV